MRKKITIFLILTFILGLSPVNSADAITQNQIDAEVQIVCPDNYGNWYSGSGTIIDSKGIILTNKHVVTDQYGSTIDTCFVGFTESINQAPNFGTTDNPNLAKVKYTTTTANMDTAILYLNNPTNQSYTYVNIWDSNSNTLQFGDKIEAIGFPSIGGATITYTSGDFSGFGSSLDGTQNYIKATTPLEHGNSGGAAYNPSGQFIGIPTMVVMGSLNSLSYILSVNSIKNWLSGILGNQYKQEIIQQTPPVEKPSVTIQDDVTPPNLKEFFLGFWGYDENDKEIAWRKFTEDDMTSRIDPWNRLRFYWYENCGSGHCVNDNQNSIKGYYYYFGNDATAVPQVSGKYISSENLLKKQEQKWFYDAKTTGQSGYFSATRVKIPELFTMNTEGKYYFKLQAIDGNNNISNTLINYEYVYETEDFKELKAIEIYDKNKRKIAEVGYTDELLESLARGANWDAQINTNQEKLFLKPDYGFPASKIMYLINKEYTDDCSTNRCDGGSISEDNYVEWNKNDGRYVFMKDYQVGRTTSFAVKHMVLDISYSGNIGNKITKGKDSELNLRYTTTERQETDNTLTNRLNGQILLQVESHGEAYYIYPGDKKRYYLGRPDDAFEIMRKLGLGATHEFITSYTIYPAHVSGKILLDVEQNGEAYYIYPKDRKAYYLGRPTDAFKIMRELGLGITNGDLNKIPEGSM